jgi:peroxiredoxin/uncharacterized membrane protein YphA (DoxX/SURF4 family)
MGFVLLVTRLLLSLVFMLAGLTKLVDRAGTRQAMLGFGVRANLAAPLAAVLPFVELVVAASLVLTVSAWWGALGALVLLLVFTVAMGYQLAVGRAPECHCFGQISSEPIGRFTLLRNLFLAALAAIVISVGPSQTDVSMTSGWFKSTADLDRLAQYLDVIIMSLLALGSLVVIIWRQQGELAQRLRDLEMNLTLEEAAATKQATADAYGHVPAPHFRLLDTAGNPVSLDDLISYGRRVVLIFSDPDCGACNSMLAEISKWQRDYANMLTVSLVSRGAAEANRVKAEQYQVAPILLQRDREVAEAYKVNATPCAVLIDTDRTLNEPVACGESQIRKLVARAVGFPTRRSLPIVSGGKEAGQPRLAADSIGKAPIPITPRIGEPAPSFRLLDLDGQAVTLDDLQGRQTLLLFWNPNCGHCDAMLADLRDWETRSSLEGTKLLIISTGDVETNRSLGLSTQIILDENLTTARAYGISGTPMAMLVDGEGRIASTVAAGASAFWKLAGPSTPRSPRSTSATA